MYKSVLHIFLYIIPFFFLIMLPQNTLALAWSRAATETTMMERSNLAGPMRAGGAMLAAPKMPILSASYMSLHNWPTTNHE
jgi:hypothetical protein